MAEAVAIEEFDYLHPDYTEVFKERAERLMRMRRDPALLAAAKIHYKENPWDFINDWGMTFDPRKLDDGETPHMPFLLWPRQREYLVWLQGMWKNKHRGQVEKSRDGGVSWLSVAWACTNWLFVPGFVAGFGSRKEELVDKTGDNKALFYMVRYFIDNIPVEFKPEGFSERLHSAYMRMNNPQTGAALVGEAGSEIGRGGRTSVYFVDEAAYVADQVSVDTSLSATTECQINISTFQGSGNRFFMMNQKLKAETPEKVFIFDWRDDPRKNEEWARRKQAELNDEVIWAQEYERDPYASQTDSFIPAKHVLAAIDAHLKLGFDGSGIRAAGFDPADTGDAKGFAFRHGSVLWECEELHDGDITYAIPWAYDKADALRAEVMGFEADGMGAPAMKLAFQDRSGERMRVEAWHGSAGVDDPDGVYLKANTPQGVDKTNHDAYANHKAQDWDKLATRFKNTYQAMQRQEQGFMINADPDDLISLSSECTHLDALKAELSSPKREWTDNGKIRVEGKKKMKARQIKSPNLAEALVVCFSMRKPVPGRKRSPMRTSGRRALKDRGMGY